LSVYLKNTSKVSFDPKRLKNIGVSLIINTTKNSSWSGFNFRYKMVLIFRGTPEVFSCLNHLCSFPQTSSCKMADFNFRILPCGSGKVIFSKDNDNFGNKQTFAKPDKQNGRWMAATQSQVGMQTNSCI